MNRNRKRHVSFVPCPYIRLKLSADIALRTSKREITVALYQTADDRKRRYLRTAHVRAIGRTNPDFAIYAQTRGDAESLCWGRSAAGFDRRPYPGPRPNDVFRAERQGEGAHQRALQEAGERIMTGGTSSLAGLVRRRTVYRRRVCLVESNPLSERT
ncbi:MAG: hypothetical protein ACR2MC_07435 [Actinomycetota bacterium]